MSRVSTTNPFDLLGDENEDRSNVPAPAKKEQKPAAPAAKPAATNAGAAKPAAPKPDAAKAPAKPADSKAAAKSGAGSNSANQTVKPAPPRDANQNLQEREKESRAPRDKRDGPGPRAPRAAGSDGNKRLYDRKSGTGRPQNEVKKGGSGKGNWGGAEAEAKDSADALKDKEEKTADEAVETDNKEETPAAAEGEKKDESAAKEGEKKDEPAKEPETRTLEEYLAAKKSKSAVVAAPLKPRTVEDQDFSAAGFVPLARGETGIPPLMQKEKKEKKEPKEAKDTKKEESDDKKKRNLAAELLTFKSHQDEKRNEKYGSYPRREGGDFRRGGGRGGGRGGSSYRGDRDNRSGDAAGYSQPPVQEKDFPSLSPHTETAPSVKA